MMAMRMRLLDQLLRWLQTHTGSSAARLAGRKKRAAAKRLRLSPSRCCTRFVKHCITVHSEPACVFQKHAVHTPCLLSVHKVACTMTRAAEFCMITRFCMLIGFYMVTAFCI